LQLPFGNAGTTNLETPKAGHKQLLREAHPTVLKALKQTLHKTFILL